MIRNLKALGLALCAVFALSAVATSAASAQVQQDKITSPAGVTTFLTGIQTGTEEENVFGTKGSSLEVHCTGATYTGSTLNNATSVTVTPKYTGCTAFTLPAPVDVNGCSFILTGATHETVDTNGNANGTEATVNLECNHTGNIKITGGFGCTITFADTHPPNAVTVNQNLLGVRYTNGSNVTAGGTHWDFEVDATVDKVTYTTSGCGFLGLPATGTDGLLTTKVTVKGYSNVAHTNQVSVTVT